MKKCASIILLALFLSACGTMRIGDFTLISTKSVNLESDDLIVGSRVTGIDPAMNPSIKGAVDNAIAQNSCAVALSDVIIALKEGRYIAEGNLVIDRNKKNCKNG